MFEIYLDAWREGWPERSLAALVTIAVALILALISWGVFRAADSWFVQDVDGVAEVEGREHQNAWIQVIIHSDGKSTWTQIIHHPESWSVKLKIDGQSDSISVRELIYDTVTDGRRVPVKYRHGRFSDYIYISEASFSESGNTAGLVSK